jgi:hypothetical protein
LNQFYFIFCELFDDAFSAWRIPSIRWQINWKGFWWSGCGLTEVLSWSFPGGTEENHKHLSQNSWCPSGDSNQVPPKYKSRVLPVDQPIQWISFSMKYRNKQIFKFQVLGIIQLLHAL